MRTCPSAYSRPDKAAHEHQPSKASTEAKLRTEPPAWQARLKCVPNTLFFSMIWLDMTFRLLEWLDLT